MRVWFFRAQHAAWWLLSCLALGIFLGTGGLLVVPASTGNAGGIAGRTIVLDAGHGGLDPGAVSAKGGLEKDIVLAIAQELERLLNKAAVSVIMVRHGDYDLADSSEMHLLNRKRQDLERRVFIAEQAQADLYISIHANFFPSPQWSGAQTFYDENQPESERLAKAIQAALVERLGPNKRLAKAGNYRVLRDTSMPAALVEVGFLSNPREAELLADPEYQTKVAEAIFVGLCTYFN
ncbi:MAG TPA: N-acetylmuramoyl-L-alanine amidase CwlD [Firmicutes bacterium]|jgi:N-acetylmuramoyl-L-alanine amidase|nr:N-acetylmuramoyl-L-alanine amidase CwlD [Bacillota bacterium]HHT42891.1 N-acetylmuramoyl-L-alanine amidase CwlD [Bacillota bacterium]